jgi:hypothetical protein
MTPFDPILHEHEKRMAMMAGLRRNLKNQMIAMDAIERRHAATMKAWEELIAERIDYELEERKRDQEWKAYHELAMKEFDDKLNGLIAWLDDFVRRNPKNGK